ncbi:MAG: lamin tail domain-containing protein, partial [Verrucomicrobiota bacterium]
MVGIRVRFVCSFFTSFLLFSLAVWPARGSIIISEILQDPSGGVSELNGEWFELYNTGGTNVDINGWLVQDQEGPIGEQFTIMNGGPLLVPPFSFFVLGVNGDTNVNGGVQLDYVYDRANFDLSNTDDSIVLFDTNLVEISRVDYENSQFPDPVGSSMYLIDPSQDPNVAGSWMISTVQVNIDIGNGSPGTTNEMGVWGNVMNSPPVVFSPVDQFVMVSNSLSFNVAASELVDGDMFTLSASNLPSGATFPTMMGNGSVTGTFTWASATPTGTYTVVFYAEDVDGVNTQAVMITVLPPPRIWINELHYDNIGTDVNEGFEIAGPAGTDLSDFGVYIYDGNDGSEDGFIALSGIIPDEGCGYGAVWFDQAPLQNQIEGLAVYDVVNAAVLHT